VASLTVHAWFRAVPVFVAAVALAAPLRVSAAVLTPAVREPESVSFLQLAGKRGFDKAPKAPHRGSSADLYGGSSADRYGGSSADQRGVAGAKDARLGKPKHKPYGNEPQQKGKKEKEEGQDEDEGENDQEAK
jgi:hypothetical protein